MRGRNKVKVVINIAGFPEGDLKGHIVRSGAKE